MTTGDFVEYSLEELRAMTMKELAEMAYGLGIGVDGLEERTEILTKLMESATDISL